MLGMALLCNFYVNAMQRIMSTNIAYFTSIEETCSICIFRTHLIMYSTTNSSIAMKEPAPGPPLGPRYRKRLGIFGMQSDM